MTGSGDSRRVEIHTDGTLRGPTRESDYREALRAEMRVQHAHEAWKLAEEMRDAISPLPGGGWEVLDNYAAYRLTPPSDSQREWVASWYRWGTSSGSGESPAPDPVGALSGLPTSVVAQAARLLLLRAVQARCLADG